MHPGKYNMQYLDNWALKPPGKGPESSEALQPLLICCFCLCTILLMCAFQLQTGKQRCLALPAPTAFPLWL